MKVTIEEMEAYLLSHYKDSGIDQNLFMKLVEEVGEVAEVLNKKAGRKSAGNEDLQAELGSELADVIHYAIAISVVGWNKRALKLYESAGFETVRKNRFYSFGRQ